jgi:integrase/recombinase XerD
METRHSSSTIMKNAGISPHYIKESLGHTSLKTTENYLAGFENEQRKEFSKVLDSFKEIEISK